jgi:hypothetical protein
MMKKKITTLGIAATLCVTPMNAQPQLRADNIDEILKAMTLAEAGSYQVMIGASIADIRAHAAFTLPKAYTEKTSDALRPKQQLNLLRK